MKWLRSANMSQRAAILAITEPFAALLAWAVALSTEGWWTQDLFWLGAFEFAAISGLRRLGREIQPARDNKNSAHTRRRTSSLRVPGSRAT